MNNLPWIAEKKFALFAFSLKISLKKESPNISVVSCVSNLTYQAEILWLNIFTNLGGAFMYKVQRLYKQSPSTKTWSKSDLPHWNICIIWTQHKAYKELHAHWMPALSPNNSFLFPWWNEPCSTLQYCRLAPDYSQYPHLVKSCQILHPEL